jgi:hypothetical protein
MKTINNRLVCPSQSGDGNGIHVAAESKGEEEATGYSENTWAKDRRVDFN